MENNNNVTGQMSNFLVWFGKYGLWIWILTFGMFCTAVVFAFRSIK